MSEAYATMVSNRYYLPIRNAIPNIRGGRARPTAFAPNLAAYDGPIELAWTTCNSLVKAGIAIIEPALVEALHNDDKHIARDAAVMLRFLTKTPRIVTSLYSTLDNPDDILALSATTSLLELGETSWGQKNGGRLLKMQDQVEQLGMAGLLARINNTEGWPIVLASLKSDRLAMMGLEYVEYFEGKQYGGMEISVRRELEQALTVAPLTARSQIQSEIDRLKKLSQ